ncbi:uncharacterized protein [Zea mays]|uniref:uncharacterized protein n=1 Tax=Zea mays TaxID=4577 RepID=UPI0016522AE4|nr:uncharacterized protein LOC103648674 [Zea mays]
MEHMRFDIMSGSIRILVVLCLKLLRTRKSPAKQTARNLFRGGDDEDDSADADTNDPAVPRSLGRVGVGHMVYISGLTCALSSTNMKVLREVASRGRHVERVKIFFRNMYICAKLFRNLTPFYFLCYSRLCFLSFPMTCYAFALYLACLKLLHKTCYIFCPKILYPCYD